MAKYVVDGTLTEAGARLLFPSPSRSPRRPSPAVRLARQAQLHGHSPEAPSSIESPWSLSSLPRDKQAALSRGAQRPPGSLGLHDARRAAPGRSQQARSATRAQRAMSPLRVRPASDFSRTTPRGARQAGAGGRQPRSPSRWPHEHGARQTKGQHLFPTQSSPRHRPPPAAAGPPGMQTPGPGPEDFGDPAVLAAALSRAATRTTGPGGHQLLLPRVAPTFDSLGVTPGIARHLDAVWDRLHPDVHRAVLQSASLPRVAEPATILHLRLFALWHSIPSLQQELLLGQLSAHVELHWYFTNRLAAKVQSAASPVVDTPTLSPSDAPPDSTSVSSQPASFVGAGSPDAGEARSTAAHAVHVRPADIPQREVPAPAIAAIRMQNWFSDDFLATLTSIFRQSAFMPRFC